MNFHPHYQEIRGSGPDVTRTAVLLHGILGSGRNWRSFVRSLLEQHPGWRFFLVDLRGHGGSFGAPPPHTLESCAHDIARLLRSIDVCPTWVGGHSFGGKVAMHYAQEYGQGLEDLWILDTPFGPGPVGLEQDDHGVEHLMRMLAKLSMPIQTRSEALDFLQAAGFGDSVCQWMGTNLARSADGFRWRFELATTHAMLLDYRSSDLWGFVEHHGGSMKLHLVYGARSDRWPEDAVERARTLENKKRLILHRLEGAGHWLQVDNPDGLRALLGKHL